MKAPGLYPCVRVDAAGSGVVSKAGGLLLIEAVRVSGLDTELSRMLAPWRRPLARHDPAKIVTDLAITLALGGDCLADLAVLRTELGLFGPVASDPTVSRAIDSLAGDAEPVLKAIDVPRAAARARVWSLVGEHAPDAGCSPDDPLIQAGVDCLLRSLVGRRQHVGVQPKCEARVLVAEVLGEFLDVDAIGQGHAGVVVP